MKIFSKLIRAVLLLLAALTVIAVVIFFTFPLPGQIPVLMYHFIGSPEAARNSGNVITVETFQRQMNFLKQFGYHVVSLDELDATLSGARKPRGREVVLTFDDGGESVGAQAVPILNSFGFSATLFVISEHLKTGAFESMKTAELLKLAQNPLIHFGAHSRTHPFLPQITDAQVTAEIEDSKRDLESLLGIPMNYFAYPYGDFDQRSIDAAQKAGFRLAFTTSPKKLKQFTVNRYCLTRVKISETAANPIIFWVKIAGIYEYFKNWRHSLYQKGVLHTSPPLI